MKSFITIVGLLLITFSAQANTPNPVTIKSLSTGDTACYLEIDTIEGKSSSLMASFAICERSDIVGRKAKLTYSKQNVMADSCEGNPDCSETQQVDLVTAVEIIPHNP